MLDLYERIDQKLSENRKTQKDLAKALGLSSAQIFSNWKQRDTIPAADTALKIAQFLNTSVEYLLTGIDTNPLSAENAELKKRLNDIYHIASL